ncbi:MAG: hypothetical protein K0U78_05785, partial [Actinomycetia bacterium]|nr:hypothetical protein [Actinomycetes bacterium]
MAKNYDGLVKGTFPSTTEAAGGAPFALAEVIRGGGTVVVKNDSDRDLLDSRVLDDRMIIWHAADTEYQFYNADGITRDSTGSLAGGTWTKLVLGGETLGALNNVNVMADAPETPPSLNEENQRHLIYDHTIKEWTPAREVIILDGIATLDSDLVITYPNFAQNVETIIPLVNTTGIMKGATESGDLYYDTDDNTITLNTEVGINATVSFQGFNYVVNTGSSSASYSTTGIDFQILRPNETEWVTLNTGKSTQLVIATLVSTIGTDNFTYDSDFKAGTKFRARSLVTFVSPVPGATLSSTHPSAASIAINGFFGTELEFDSNDVDRRKETQDAFLLYVEGANSSLPSKWVSTRLIEDFTDTDVDGLNVTVSDTDYSFALGRVSSANSDSEVLTTPIGFSNGIDNSNVFIYDPVDLSFEYVGAKDTDVTFTIPSLEVAALITAAQKHRRIFQVSTDAGVTWSVISGSAFDTTAVISINRQTISYAGGTVTHKAFRGYKYRLAFEFHRVETLASAILYSGIIPGTTQLTATGSYHILTGGFASQEYVDSQIGLLDKKRQDSDADIVT